MIPAPKAAAQNVEQRKREERMELTMQGEDFQALLAVQQAITSRLEPSAVLKMISAEARRISQAEKSGVFWLNGQPLQAAELQERQQRAGELHDAVTQTLFSASLIADVLPRLLERDPREGMARMEELRRLTRGALAEMQVLLMELRPSALTESTFDLLVAQLADCCAARAHIPVDFTAGEFACQLPDDVQIGLYRIIQDALRGICVEGQAKQGTISLRSEPCSSGSRIHLTITYQGANICPIHRMQERAKDIGASIQANDLAEQGKQILISWAG